jgi:hypothetical protein
MNSVRRGDGAVQHAQQEQTLVIQIEQHSPMDSDGHRERRPNVRGPAAQPADHEKHQKIDSLHIISIIFCAAAVC